MPALIACLPTILIVSLAFFATWIIRVFSQDRDSEVKTVVKKRARTAGEAYVKAVNDVQRDYPKDMNHYVQYPERVDE